MKICYINFSFNNPRDRITLRGLRENGVAVIEIADKTPGWRKYFNIAKKYYLCRKECDLIMIGYAGGVLVLFLKLLTRKKIVYNALSSFFDGMIVSRLRGKIFSLTALKFYLLDLFVFHCADQIFLESQTQKYLVVKIYKVHPRKISVHFVGADDQQFHPERSVSKLSNFTVVFRGAFLPEAGVDVLILAAKKFERENIQLRILGHGLLQKELEGLIQELKPKNVELITAVLPIEVLRTKMLECHLSLGQLSNHPRVHTTIPHKAFESMCMKLPYLTGANKGVLEILSDNQTCFTISPGDYHELSQKIIDLKGRPQELERVAENSYRLYQEKFTPRILAQKIIRDLQSLAI